VWKFTVALAVLCTCRSIDSGLSLGDAGQTSEAGSVSALKDAYAGANETPPPPKTDAEPSVRYPTASVAGCSDGTREGFLDATTYPDIAACSGAFTDKGVHPSIITAPALPGAGGPPTQLVNCNRNAGNTGNNPKGEQCRATDLCALGWHLCWNAVDVATHTPNHNGGGCPAGEDDDRFFVVAMGASEQGVCAVDSSAKNDLHGCGGLGQAENPTCAPLLRRMSFADCLASPSWGCGTEDNQFNETEVVTKPGIDQGGVLCCRD